MATINSGNSTTLYSTTQTTTSVNTPSNVPAPRVNDTNFTTLYSNTSASATGGGTSGNLLVSGNLRVLGTSDLEGAVTIGNSYVLPTSDGTYNQVIVTDGNGNLTFQNVEAIDNIPDGTAKGQVLYWDGSQWLANSTLTFDATANRLRLVNNVSGGATALDLLKQYTGTLADGSNVSQLFGFYDGGTLSSVNPRYNHRLRSEYDTTSNPIFRVEADPVGNFVFGSTTTYTTLRVDNDYLGINGSELTLLLNVTGTPTQNATIRVNRGSQTDATITWDEANEERWESNYDFLATGLQGGNVQIAMNGTGDDNTIYIGGNDLQINTDGSHVIQSNSPFLTTAQSISINSDSTAADSYLYLKGTSVAIKYNNTTNYIEMPRTAIDNILIDDNTISTVSGTLNLAAANSAINIENNLYVDGIYEQYGEYIKINVDSTAADSYLYMKGTSQYLKWDNSNNFFNLNADVFGSASIIANTYLATNGNTIFFNNDDVSAADSYLSVKRGASPDVSIRWNQATSRWQFTNDGTTYYDMAVSIDDLTDVVITPPVAAGQFLVQDGTNWVNSSVATWTSNTYRSVFQGKNGINGRGQTGAAVLNNTGAVNFDSGDGSGLLVGVDSDGQSLVYMGSLSTTYVNGGNHQVRLATSTNNFASDQATSITGGNTLVFPTAHGFSVGDRLGYAGKTQNGLTFDTYYYVIATGFTTTQCQVSLTQGGSAVALTNGTGLSLWFFNGQDRVFGASSTEATIAGSNLILNATNTGIAFTGTAGLEIERGTSGTNATLYWNESNNRWEVSTDLSAPQASIGNIDISRTTGQIDTNGGVNLILDSDGGTVLINDNLNVDSGTLYVDATNNYVGVNDATPSYPLDVNGIINTNASVQCDFVTIDGQATLDSNTTTTTSTATVPLNATARNAMTGLINIIQGSNVHCVNYTAVRVDSTTALLTTYAEMYNTSALANFSADVSGGLLRLLVTPTSATSTIFSAVRTSLT